MDRRPRRRRLHGPPRLPPRQPFHLTPASQARHDAPAQRPGALPRLLSTPFYRGAALALFLSGLGTSIAVPQIVLFLTRDLAAPLPLAALFYLTGVTAPFAGYLVGRQSDRTGRRMGLFRLCVATGFLGWAGMALSTAVWQPFVLNAVLLAFSAASTAQLFAALHDVQMRDPHPANDGITALVRMALTFGWVVGPALGVWLAAATSLRAAFWTTAVIFLAQVLPVLRHRDLPAEGQGPAAGAQAPASLPALMPLLVFTLLFVLIYLGEPIKYGFLPIHMDTNLNLPPGLRGAVIGIQPLVELLLMAFAVPLARRIGALQAMALAAALTLGANLCFAVWPSALGMFAGQVLMGGTWAIAFVIGTLIAQRLLPGAVATASAVFLNASPFAAALGGAIGGAGVAGLGLPGVFLLPALLSAVAAVGLLAFSRRNAIGL